MSEIIICNGLCDQCEAAKICPQKSEVHKMSDCWECEDNPIPFAVRENIWDKISPAWVFSEFSVSITNLLTMLEATVEPENQHLLKKKIEKFIWNSVSKNRGFIEIIEHECAKDLARKFGHVINQITERITMVFHGQCPAQNCHRCWMSKDCEQRDRSIDKI